MLDITGKTVAELTTLYNTRAERPIKKFDNKTVAIERVNRLAKDNKLEIVETPAGLQFAEKAAATKKRKKTPASSRGRVRYSDDMIIVVQRDERPKRITKRNPYAVYETGLTVGQALEKGVKRRDINWDASPQRPDGPVIRVVTKEQYARMADAKNGANV